VAMIPRSVLTTFPDRRRLSVHALAPGDNRMKIDLVWRIGAGSPNVQALGRILRK
jgi:hypothetical protein